MSYEKYYQGGWKSGETGGTPITPEALNHMENGIETANKNLLPEPQEANNATFLRNDNTWQQVTPANIGAVPTSRTVNGKALSEDITLSASDVGAGAIYGSLVETGIVTASTTTEEVLKAMPINSQVTFTHSTANTVKLTDAPFSYGNVTLIKGATQNYQHGWGYANSGSLFKYKQSDSQPERNGWESVNVSHTLLWENASPTSELAGSQNITFNRAGYTFLLLEIKMEASVDDYISLVVRNETNLRVRSCATGSNNFERPFVVGQTGLYISDCYSQTAIGSQTKYNNGLILHRVYGVR